MSIIRQRRKNLILSGMLGFLIGCFALVALGVVFRGQLFTYFGIELNQVQEAPVLATTWVAAKPIAKGTIIEVDHLMQVEVPIETMVKPHFSDSDDLIGKQTIMDIDTYMPLTSPMFLEEALIDQNLRLYEMSFIELPYHLAIGDTVDVRITFPTGQSYVVLSKKEVRAFERSAQSVHSGLLTLALDEEEVLRMSSTLVDIYTAEGTTVYLAKYVDGDNQKAATVNYPVNVHVQRLLLDNPNVLEMPNLAEVSKEREKLKEALALIIDQDNQVNYTVGMGAEGLSPLEEADEIPDETKEVVLPVEQEVTETEKSVVRPVQEENNESPASIGF